MITALNVANTFIARAKEDGIDVTPMKLQKLIYIFYKTYLKRTKTRLFSDFFEVWQYGPVIDKVYQAFKSYRSNAITDFYYDDEKKSEYTTVALKKGSDFLEIFNEVWEKYGQFDGIYLSMLTHQANTAWSKADAKNLPLLSDGDIIEEEDYDV